MTKKIAVVFPGQGSQSIGMLNKFMLIYPDIISDVFNTASEILKYNLLNIITDGPVEKLNQTEITQPALLTASVALWKLWQTKSDINPVVLAGHSLGEYSALVCSGVLRFEDAVMCVANRGKYMQEAVPEGKGAMAAIIGLSSEVIDEICQKSSQGQVVSAANINSPGQIVIAGDVDAVERVMAAAKQSGAKLIKKLDVSVPSHCALMNSAADKLKILLESIAFHQPKIPVIQNTTASATNSIADIKSALFQQLSQPVRWVESVENMVRDFVPDIIIECGPGKVLAGLNKRIVNIPTISIEEALHV
ncbi:MAG TPA: ACP S-malonyltransferase [Gammaproteobacteria bacterium]|nr:ACP S-malonyltransferase [Gammaproteobacteria bacterium]